MAGNLGSFWKPNGYPHQNVRKMDFGGKPKVKPPKPPKRVRLKLTLMLETRSEASVTETLRMATIDEFATWLVRNYPHDAERLGRKLS